MTVLCRILIAVTLVVHMMVGCCAHHAHACEGHLSRAHGGATHDSQSLGNGCGHSRPHATTCCQGERCSFVSPDRPVSELLAFSCQTFCTAVLDDQPPLVGFGTAQISIASGRLLLPVRLHLANQVLLI
jgi:hypothetical protein